MTHETQPQGDATNNRQHNNNARTQQQQEAHTYKKLIEEGANTQEDSLENREKKQANTQAHAQKLTGSPRPRRRRPCSVGWTAAQTGAARALGSCWPWHGSGPAGVCARVLEGFLVESQQHRPACFTGHV